MTWKEFKKEVDRQLKEKGVSEDEPLNYIDINGGFGELEKEDIEVIFTKGLGITI